MTKPMLASDWDETKVRFPIGMQPKIDGVRGVNFGNGLTGRSLKFHKNIYTTQFFSQSGYVGFDGELAAESETHPALCRLTSSAIGTIKGSPFVLWHAFDYITQATINLPYHQRYEAAKNRISFLNAHFIELWARIKLVPMVIVNNIDELEAQDAKWLGKGYEGSILRDLNGVNKQGRSTVNEGGLLRIKRFSEEEAVVNRIIEGQRNANEATIGLLGQTERSSHQENMIPNGMVGALECTDVKTGKEIIVSAGCMAHEERLKYFAHPELILRKQIKYKTFLKGVKDKPRFPTFQSIKLESDIG